MSDVRSIRNHSYFGWVGRYGLLVVILTLYHFACNNPEPSRPAATRPDSDSISSVAVAQALRHETCDNPVPIDEAPDIQPGDNNTTKKAKRLVHYLKHKGKRKMQTGEHECFEFYQWVLEVHRYILKNGGYATPGFESDGPPPPPGPW